MIGLFPAFGAEDPGGSAGKDTLFGGFDDWLFARFCGDTSTSGAAEDLSVFDLPNTNANEDTTTLRKAITVTHPHCTIRGAWVLLAHSLT